MPEWLIHFLMQPFALRRDVYDQLMAMVPGLMTRAGGEAMSMSARAEPIDPTTMVGRVAVIDVAGPLSNQVSIWRYFGLDESATLSEIEAAVKAAAANENVSAILLRVNSPGGTVAGTAAVGEAARAARSAKPTWAYCSDCACSAAFWIASQAERVYSNSTADLANIGVYSTLYDYSKMFEELGIKAEVIASGPLKGIGVQGAALTDEQRTHLLDWVGTKRDLFVDVVAAGRGLERSRVDAVADGRMLVGQQAVDAGLINGVQSFDATLAMLDIAGRVGERGAGVSGGGVGVRMETRGSNFEISSGGGGSSTQTQGDGEMNPQLRAFLESKGLKSGATDQEAAVFWSELKGEDKAKADGLATAPVGGGQGGGTPPPPAASPAGGANGDGSDGGGGQGGVPPVAPTSAPVQGAGGPALPTRSEIQGIATEAAAFAADLPVDAFTTMHSLKGSTLAEVQQAAAAYVEHAMPAIGQTVTVGDDGRESLTSALGDVLSMRMGLEVAEPHGRVGELEHLSMVEIGRRHLAMLGVAGVDSMLPEDVGRLLMDKFELAGHLGGVAIGHSTSDFVGILGTSATRTLVEGFEEEPVTYSQWARNEELPDLNEWEEYAGGGVPMPKRIVERGEYELVTFAFKSEKKRVYKHGLKVGLTLEMIIQDRLNAFSESLMDFGGAARTLRNHLVYAELTGNRVMKEDVTAMFHSDHSNLNNGGAVPLDIADEAKSRAAIVALGKGRVAMRQQKAISPDGGETEGRNIRITPAFLLTSEEQASAARVLYGSPTMPGQSNAGVPNPEGTQNVAVISDPELSDVSATAWYLLGQKRKSPVKSLTLRGYGRPTLTRTSVIRNDTIEYQLRDFCGAAPVEWRSAYRNDGA